MSGYIYLIHLREFINNNQSIYKIGKTSDTCCRKINTRFSAYPKDSVIKIIIQVLDMHNTENKLKQIFATLFEKQSSIGDETFKGNLYDMISEICKFIPSTTNVEVKSIDYKQIEQTFQSQYFYPIYRDFQNKINNQYNLYNARSIFEIHGLLHITNSSGKSICEKPTIVDINKTIIELKKIYNNPTKSKPVTCENYNKYCGIINTISNTISYIINYEKARLTMVNPQNHIQIK